jgi:N-acetylneuraminic acid mutarotase
MAAYKRQLYTFGGFDPTDVIIDELHVYDIDSKFWEKVIPRSDSPEARHGHAIFGVKTGIYMLGGKG